MSRQEIIPIFTTSDNHKYMMTYYKTISFHEIKIREPKINIEDIDKTFSQTKASSDRINKVIAASQTLAYGSNKTIQDRTYEYYMTRTYPGGPDHDFCLLYEVEFKKLNSQESKYIECLERAIRENNIKNICILHDQLSLLSNDEDKQRWESLKNIFLIGACIRKPFPLNLSAYLIINAYSKLRSPDYDNNLSPGLYKYIHETYMKFFRIGTGLSYSAVGLGLIVFIINTILKHQYIVV